MCGGHGKVLSLTLKKGDQLDPLLLKRMKYEKGLISLSNEEALLFAKYLRNEKEIWELRIALLS